MLILFERLTVATKKQKQELVDILKFTPTTYKISIQNYGGECYIGRVDRKIYDFFKQHRIDLEEYATDWDNKFDFVPEDLRPFPPGSPYECDNLCHASGPELSDSNMVTVEDDKGDTVWESPFGIDELEDQGCEVSEWETAIIEDEPDGQVVFWGGQGEKGLCFGGEIELKQPFDPKKLKFSFSNCDGWWICNGASYDGEDIENNDYSTTGKWGENKWVIAGGEEEVYEGVSRDDIDEEDQTTVSEWPVVETDLDETPSMPELPKTEWYPGHIKPVNIGMYEVEVAPPLAWPFPTGAMYEWTGKKWLDVDGKSVKKIAQWRGLAINLLNI
jgi:hypothetical protein